MTRTNRRYHYLDAAGTYAKYSAKDPEVQAGYKDYIEQADPEKNHPTWHPASDNPADIEAAIYAYLTSKELDVEMSDEDYVDFMVWHRGLAVPAARNVDDPDVLKGKELFEQIGCTYCHKPSWTTGDDNFYDPNGVFSKGDSRLPKYPNQKIWPYSDMIQHKLYMENDIRTGWCRTTPLWGRGLHQSTEIQGIVKRRQRCNSKVYRFDIRYKYTRLSSHRRIGGRSFKQTFAIYDQQTAENLQTHYRHHNIAADNNHGISHYSRKDKRHIICQPTFLFQSTVHGIMVRSRNFRHSLYYKTETV